MDYRRRSDPDEPREFREERVPGRWRWRWRPAGREGWHRGRISGGYGSQFDAWRSGTGISSGFGFGPEEAPGGFQDDDWQVTRPARGGSTWAGDWEYSPEHGRSRRDRGYAGRGPRSYQRADDRIYEEVCERLTEDGIVDASEVTVSVENGAVTLSGTVPTRDQKWRAEECADDVGGVREVVNQLRAERR